MDRELFDGNFSHLPLIQVSQIQEDSSILEAMGLQCIPKTSLLNLLESYAGGNAPEKAVQPKPTTLSSTQVSQIDPTDKKRKRDQKGKEVMEERRNLPLKEVESQRGARRPGSCRRVTNKLKSRPGPHP